MVETIGFQISGEFITNIARQWFWDENKDYEIVEELLLNSLITDALTLEERKDIALSIIEGRKKLTGINSLSLEDDGENIRPIYKKINELKRRTKIKEIEEDIELNPINYIDEYATNKSYKLFLDMANNKDDEDFYSFISIENIQDYFFDEQTCNNTTKSGLWLLEKANLIFDLIGEPLTQNNRHSFFEKLYEHLKETKDEDILKRQRNYEKYKKVLSLDLDKTTDLPAYKKEDYLFGEPKLDYYRRPDDQIKDLAWVNKYGDWYSCEFGGHQLKAEVIVTGDEKLKKDFKSWLEEKGTKKGASYSVPYYRNNNWKISGSELYSEYLLQRGWVKFHNPYMGESHPEYYLKPTKEQLDAIFKASIKFKYSKIQGLEE